MYLFKLIFLSAVFCVHIEEVCFGTTTFVCDACQHHLRVWRHVPIYITI